MNDAQTESRLRWIDEGGHEFLLVDLRGAPADEGLRIIDSVPKVLDGRAPGSVRSLVDVTDSGYDPSVANRWKAAHLAYASTVRATAVFGISGIVGVTLRGFINVLSIMGLAKPNGLKLFASRDEAVAWLRQQ